MGKSQASSLPPSPPLTLTSESQPGLQPKSSSWLHVSVFASTFLTIFLAELGDKTQITILLMSAQSGAPWVVFLGAAIALVATSLAGVLLGRWLSTRLSPRTLERAAGFVLLVIATTLVWDIWQH